MSSNPAASTREIETGLRMEVVNWRERACDIVDHQITRPAVGKDNPGVLAPALLNTAVSGLGVYATATGIAAPILIPAWIASQAVTLVHSEFEKASRARRKTLARDFQAAKRHVKDAIVSAERRFTASRAERCLVEHLTTLYLRYENANTVKAELGWDWLRMTREVVAASGALSTAGLADVLRKHFHAACERMMKVYRLAFAEPYPPQRGRVFMRADNRPGRTFGSFGELQNFCLKYRKIGNIFAPQLICEESIEAVVISDGSGLDDKQVRGWFDQAWLYRVDPHRTYISTGLGDFNTGVDLEIVPIKVSELDRFPVWRNESQTKTALEDGLEKVIEKYSGGSRSLGEDKGIAI